MRQFSWSCVSYCLGRGSSHGPVCPTVWDEAVLVVLCVLLFGMRQFSWSCAECLGRGSSHGPVCPIMLEKRDLLRVVSRKLRVRSECSVGCCYCVHELRTHTHTHTPWVTAPPHTERERERERERAYQKVQGEGGKVDVRLLNIWVSYLLDA